MRESGTSSRSLDLVGAFNGTGSQSSFRDYYDISVLSEENTWSFGQVVSLAIMALPFVSFFGKCSIANGCSYYLRLTNFQEAYSSPPDIASLQMKTFSVAQNATAPSSTASPPHSISITSSTSHHIQTDIAKEPWYKKLVISLYLVSVELAISSILFLPAQNGTDILSLQTVETLLIIYCILIVVIFLILWFLTLIFIDCNIQSWWKRIRIGKAISEKKILSNTCWGVVVISICLINSFPLLFLVLAGPASFLAGMVA